MNDTHGTVSEYELRWYFVDDDADMVCLGTSNKQ